MLTVACLACAAKPIDPLRLDGRRLTVNNRTPNDWKDVQIWVNRQYRMAVPVVLAGQRMDASLDEFLEGYGHRFNFARQQITDVRLSAKLASGEPVEIVMPLRAGGLADLAGVGVFKGKK